MPVRKPLVSLVLVALTYLPTVAIGQATPLEQRKAQVYAMGVNFGIASYFSSALSCCSNMRSAGMLRGAESGLGNVNIDLAVINSTQGAGDNFLPFQQIQALKTQYGELAGKFDQCAQSTFCPYLSSPKTESGPTLQRMFAQAVSLRDGITGKFAGLSKRLTDTYVLGVNVGIAEGHATQGESGRQVVLASLMNAKAAAVQLNIDVAPIDACIALASGSTPMNEVYQRIVSMRSTYQSLI